MTIFGEKMLKKSILGRLGATWRPKMGKNASWEAKAAKKCDLEASWAVLEASGAVLEASWGVLEASWGVLEVS